MSEKLTQQLPYQVSVDGPEEASGEWVFTFVPALLMQEETCRIILEPLGRSSLDTEGMVDLYLMPAYDDIARLFYYGDQWNLHYAFPGTTPGSTVREAPPLPLSKATLSNVLA